MANGFGLSKKPVNDYEIYLGKLVRIHFSNGAYIGVVNNVKNDFIDLKPSMIQEGIVSSKGKTRRFVRLERETPLRINTYNIEAVEPLKKGYLEKLIESINTKEK